ncbi:MAG: glycosyltransferase [Thermoleophilia bacterium]|nr:glycosyltransferase [Thermoleophilia bacterium]
MAAGLWGGALALAAYERHAVPDAADALPAADDPLPVVAVVPARDEARGVGACVASLLAQRPPLRGVVLVDDGSTDGTAEAARAAGRGDPRLRVVPAGPLPAGWVGKPWACWRGVREAGDAEWLLFSDADVVHAPDAVARTLGLARREGRGGATLVPRVRTGTRVERWVLPAAVVAIGTFVAPGPLARHPRSPVAIAAGGFILIERGLYGRVGGHRGQAGHMVDDVALALRVKCAGGLLVPALGHGLVSLRMYHGARELWRGWRKNASFAHPGGPGKALAGAALVTLMTLAPWVAAARGATRRRGAMLRWGLLGIGAQAGLQRMAAPAVPTPVRDAATLPVGMLVLSAAAVQGAVDRLTGRGAVWRGRRYPAAR